MRKRRRALIGLGAVALFSGTACHSCSLDIPFGPIGLFGSGSEGGTGCVFPLFDLPLVDLPSSCHGKVYMTVPYSTSCDYCDCHGATSYPLCMDDSWTCSCSIPPGYTAACGDGTCAGTCTSEGGAEGCPAAPSCKKDTYIVQPPCNDCLDDFLCDGGTVYALCSKGPNYAGEYVVSCTLPPGYVPLCPDDPSCADGSSTAEAAPGEFALDAPVTDAPALHGEATDVPDGALDVGATDAGAPEMDADAGGE